MWTRTEEGGQRPTRQPCWALSISVRERGMCPPAPGCQLWAAQGEGRKESPLGSTAAPGWLSSLGWSPAQALLRRVPLPRAPGKPPQPPCPRGSEAAPGETHRIQQALGEGGFRGIGRSHSLGYKREEEVASEVGREGQRSSGPCCQPSRPRLGPGHDVYEPQALEQADEAPRASVHSPTEWRG